MNNKKLILLNGEEDLDIGVDGFFIRGEQEITDEFLRDLDDRRFRSSHVREGDFMHVASIPVEIVNKWKREGFDIIGDRNITAAEIVARLKAEEHGRLLATNKKV